MSAIVRVTPRHVAEYRAAQFDPANTETVAQMAARADATIKGWVLTRRKGRAVEVFRIVGRNRRLYDLIEGEWLVVLGTSGAFRVCTEKQYREDYRVVTETEMESEA